MVMNKPQSIARRVAQRLNRDWDGEMATAKAAIENHPHRAALEAAGFVGSDPQWYHHDGPELLRGQHFSRENPAVKGSDTATIFSTGPSKVCVLRPLQPSPKVEGLPGFQLTGGHEGEVKRVHPQADIAPHL